VVANANRPIGIRFFGEQLSCADLQSGFKMLSFRPSCGVLSAIQVFVQYVDVEGDQTEVDRVGLPLRPFQSATRLPERIEALAQHGDVRLDAR